MAGSVCRAAAWRHGSHSSSSAAAAAAAKRRRRAAAPIAPAHLEPAPIGQHLALSCHGGRSEGLRAGEGAVGRAESVFRAAANGSATPSHSEAAAHDDLRLSGPSCSTATSCHRLLPPPLRLVHFGSVACLHQSRLPPQRHLMSFIFSGMHGICSTGASSDTARHGASGAGAPMHAYAAAGWAPLLHHLCHFCTVSSHLPTCQMCTNLFKLSVSKLQ